MTWVDQVFYDSAATTDFTPFLTKLLGEKPDIIDFSASPTGSAALICKTARGLGFTGILSYGGKTAAADMVKIAGQDALEGVLTTNLPLLPPQVSDVVIGLPARETAKYGAAYGNTWDFYSQASIMIAAMKRANSVDSTAVRNILQDSTQKWPYVAINGGVATFGSAVAQQVYGANNASHQLYCSWPICIIRGGKDTIGAIITPP
jgi:branched-chain amino acid transport system substrate-binding protein